MSTRLNKESTYLGIIVPWAPPALLAEFKSPFLGVGRMVLRLVVSLALSQLCA